MQRRLAWLHSDLGYIAGKIQVATRALQAAAERYESVSEWIIHLRSAAEDIVWKDIKDPVHAEEFRRRTGRIWLKFEDKILPVDAFLSSDRYLYVTGDTRAEWLCQFTHFHFQDPES